MGKYGRLGNQLWTHANVLAFCLEQKVGYYSAVFPSDARFTGSENLSSTKRLKNVCIGQSKARTLLLRGMYKAALRIRRWPIVHLGERNCLNLDKCAEQLRRVASERTTFLTGLYFSAPESMSRHRSDLRTYFSPARNIQDEVDAILWRARDGADLLIGVHMRRGDYRTYCDGIMYYTPAEYADVMRSLVRTVGDGRKVRFLICSDESVDPGDFKGLDVVVSAASPLADMYSLAGCDLIFGPNSTFSHWASFYGDVPLHILGYKSKEKQGASGAIRCPDPERDFHVFDPARFVTHARDHVGLVDLLGERWLA